MTFNTALLFTATCKRCMSVTESLLLTINEVCISCMWKSVRPARTHGKQTRLHPLLDSRLIHLQWKNSSNLQDDPVVHWEKSEKVIYACVTNIGG